MATSQIHSVARKKQRHRGRSRRLTAAMLGALLAPGLLGLAATTASRAEPGAKAASPRFSLVSGESASAAGLTYFAANDGTHGLELWRTDGTAAGTRMVADLDPGSDGSFFYNGVSMASTGSRLFFIADGSLYVIDPGQAPRVVTSDWTTAPYRLEALGDDLIAIASHAIYRVDADDRVYRLVRDRLDVLSEGPMAVVGGFLYFGASELGESDFQLWRTNGTPSGTTLVKRVRADGDAHVMHLTAVGNRLFFYARNPDDVWEEDLWTSDGTSAGTRRIAAAPRFTFDYHYVVADGRYYFAAATAETGRELWSTTGGAPTLVKDIRRGSGDSSPRYLTRVGKRVAFVTDTLWGSTFQDGNVWVTNGTGKGTKKFHDQGQGAILNGWVDPSSMMTVAGRLTFVTLGDAGGGNAWQGQRYRVWRSALTTHKTWTIGNRTPFFQPDLYLRAGKRVVVIAKRVGDDKLGFKSFLVAKKPKHTKMKRAPKIRGKVKVGHSVRYTKGRWTKGKAHYRWLVGRKTLSTQRQVYLSGGKGKYLRLEVRVRLVGGPDKVWRSKRHRIQG